MGIDKLLEGTGPQVVLLTAGLALLIVFGVYVVGKVRALLRDDGGSTNELLTNFRDLHSKGELDDEEFRTIKSMLADRFQHELKDTGKEG